MAFYSTDIPTISFISSSSVFLASNLLVRTGVSPTATSEIPTFRFQHQGHGSHESWEIRCLENLTKNDNGSQNDTARHRKITYRTVRNRTKMRKWQKNAIKLQEKSVRNRTWEFDAFSFDFSKFFPRACRWKCRKARLKLDLTFQCLPNSLLELPCVFLLAETQLRHEMTFVPLKVLILPPI